MGKRGGMRCDAIWTEVSQGKRAGGNFGHNREGKNRDRKKKRNMERKPRRIGMGRRGRSVPSLGESESCCGHEVRWFASLRL